MTRRLVVLGTGTGVGKTWVTTVLTRLLASRSLAVVALKPIETGVVDVAHGSDFRCLADASSFPVEPPPYPFAPPVSPHLAARHAGVAIELEQILTYVRYHESSRAPDWVLIESAGGLFSPLAAGRTNFDLARALEPAVWLLVASDSLGVLHDVTATLGLARALGRVPDHLLLSPARDADDSTGSNASELATLGIATSVFSARREDPTSLTPLVDALLR